jgi:hypothetical protein
MAITGIPYEPMRQNRYIFEFPKQLEVAQYLVKKVSNLVLNINSGWEDLIITIYPIAGKDTMKLLVNYINNPENRHPLTFQLKNLDPTGVELQILSITGLPCSVEFIGLDYSNDDMSEIKLSIKVYQVVVL